MQSAPVTVSTCCRHRGRHRADKLVSCVEVRWRPAPPGSQATTLTFILRVPPTALVQASLPTTSLGIHSHLCAPASDLLPLGPVGDVQRNSTMASQMYVRVKRKNQTMFIYAEPSETVDSLKRKIEAIVKVSPAEMRLYSDLESTSHVMSDKDTLDKLGVKAEQELALVFKLPGTELHCTPLCAWCLLWVQAGPGQPSCATRPPLPLAAC